MRLARWLPIFACFCFVHAGCSLPTPLSRELQARSRSAPAQDAPPSARAPAASADPAQAKRAAELAERERAAQAAGDTTARARIAIERLELAIDADDWNEARACFSRALELAPALASDEERLQFERMACSVCEELALPDARREHARRWVELASAHALPPSPQAAAGEAQARIELAATLGGERRESERRRALQLADDSGAADTRACVRLDSACLLAEDGLAKEALVELEGARKLATEPQTRARIEGVRGNVLLDLGRDEEAHEAYAASEALAREHGIRLPGFEAQYLHAAALRLAGESRPLEAIPRLERALELHEQRGNLADIGQTLLSLGSTYEQAIAQGPCDAGRRAEFRTRQRALYGRLAAPESEAKLSTRVRGQIGLAISYEDEDLASAAAILTKAEQMLADSALELPRAELLSARAWLSYLQARKAEARDAGALLADAQQRAVRSARLFQACGHLDAAFAVRDTAFRALLQLGRLDEAESLLTAAEDELGLHVGRVDAGRFSSLPFASLSYFEGHRQDWTARMLARMELSGADRERIVRTGFESAGRWKGRQLLARILERDARRDEGIRRVDSERSRRKQLAEALESTPAAEAPADRPEEAVARDEQRLARGIWDAVEAQGSLHAIRAALPGPDAALLVFAAGAVDVVAPEQPSELYVYVLTARGLTIVDLGAWNELRKQVERYVEGLSCGASDPLPLPTLVQYGHELYEALVEKPLAALPPDERAELKRLVVVPEHGLESLPFDALVVEPVLAAKDPQGKPREVEFRDQHWLLDAFEISSAPSAPVLAALSRHRARRTDLDALVVVDARYDASAAQGGDERSGLPLERLQHTLGEGVQVGLCVLDQALRSAAVEERMALKDGLVEISRLLVNPIEQRDLDLERKGLHFACGSKATPALLTGTDPEVPRDLTRYAVIHFGVHGSFDLADPDQAALLLAPGAHESGRLTRWDIVNRLRLDSPLVYLSVCDGAHGLSAPGEGALSIAEAFLLAGAGSVVAANWALKDDKAASLAQAFYATYLGAMQTRSAASALREAKRKLLQDHKRSPAPVPVPPGGAAEGSRWEPRCTTSSDPYYWASMVAIGAP